MIGDDLASVKAAANQLDRWQVPGLQVAAVQGEAIYAGGAGVRGVDDPAPVGARTLFHHGSCAKAYTALCASVLHERGVLDLDARFAAGCPSWSCPIRSSPNASACATCSATGPGSAART
ncbi:MAG TPA: serine hydrolase domain-containing protein [Jatrophihabitantaceae bacterium]|nr:serine hydrolase domain-containing protein [Jatrophihabitantaceae bacterium]